MENLECPHCGIQKYDQEDHDGIFQISDRPGNDRRADQDDDHEIAELVEQHAPWRMRAFFL